MPKKPLLLSEIKSIDFNRRKNSIDTVCAGDSITGWNNSSNKLITYPHFLQQVNGRLDVADCGIAREYSFNGLNYVREFLKIFPNSLYFIIGFGTNDLALSENLKRTSRNIIRNLDSITTLLMDSRKIPILINVPYVNFSRFPAEVSEYIRKQRDYHNKQLKKYFELRGVKVTDICSVLKDEHFKDNLHPNEQGARLIAEEVNKILKTYKGALNTDCSLV